ncbi:hypothetical protein BKE38_20725 [Pseudoroseomonas deserti]|uniref:Uncharacterized protein n=1 Tax=Teichococcus deserti TaxID=1817963 RepID=A0A1V2GXH2_9PROT|nr:hypothetical protein BKE38_20725 [Pseudoroseomonas deserti]
MQHDPPGGDARHLGVESEGAVGIELLQMRDLDAVQPARRAGQRGIGLQPRDRWAGEAEQHLARRQRPKGCGVQHGLGSPTPPGLALALPLAP